MGHLTFRYISYRICYMSTITTKICLVERQKILDPNRFLLTSLIKVVIAGQYVLLAILVIVIYQILLTSQFYTALLTWTTGISYSLTVILIGILARQFSLWYRSHKKDSFNVRSYATAFARSCRP